MKPIYSIIAIDLLKPSIGLGGRERSLSTAVPEFCSERTVGVPVSPANGCTDTLSLDKGYNSILRPHITTPRGWCTPGMMPILRRPMAWSWTTTRSGAGRLQKPRLPPPGIYIDRIVCYNKNMTNYQVHHLHLLPKQVG